MLLLVILCIIWRCPINMFWSTCLDLSIHALGCKYGLLYHVVILLQSCLMMLLSACLHEVQCFHDCFLVIHAPYELVLAMLSFINLPSYCRYACFVMHCFVVSASSSPSCLHIIVSAMLCFLHSLKPITETCDVYVVSIISSVTFGLMDSKGHLLYALSRFMPCLVLPC